MPPNSIEDYLALDEELRLSFAAESVLRGKELDSDQPLGGALQNNSLSPDYTFGATDRRVIYLDNDGSFKDIDYTHISSIESKTEKAPNLKQGLSIGLGICGGVFFLGGLGAIVSNPGLGFLVLLIGGGLLAWAVKVFDTHELEEKQKITLITGDEANQQVEVTLSQDTEGNIGASLSKILREQR